MDHPNLVKLYEVIDDEEDEKLHMIMQYCPFGQIMKFDEETAIFTPCKALLLDKQSNAKPPASIVPPLNMKSINKESERSSRHDEYANYLSEK